MFHRSIILLTLITQVLFLNVIIPGHVRGMITMDGKRDCCSMDSTSDEVQAGAPKTCCQKPVDKSAPTRKDRAKCFICYLSHGITPIAIWTQEIADLGLLKPFVQVDPVLPMHVRCVVAYLPCGPPGC